MIYDNTGHNGVGWEPILYYEKQSSGWMNWEKWHKRISVIEDKMTKVNDKKNAKSPESKIWSQKQGFWNLLVD